MTGTDYEHTEERDDNTFKDLYHYTDISQREIDSGRPCGDLSTLVQAKEDYAPCYGGGTEHLDTYLYISLYGHFNVGEASSSGFYTMSWRATRCPQRLHNHPRGTAPSSHPRARRLPFAKQLV